MQQNLPHKSQGITLAHLQPQPGTNEAEQSAGARARGRVGAGACEREAQPDTGMGKHTRKG